MCALCFICIDRNKYGWSDISRSFTFSTPLIGKTNLYIFNNNYKMKFSFLRHFFTSFFSEILIEFFYRFRNSRVQRHFSCFEHSYTMRRYEHEFNCSFAFDNKFILFVNSHEIRIIQLLISVSFLFFLLFNIFEIFDKRRKRVKQMKQKHTKEVTNNFSYFSLG